MHPAGPSKTAGSGCTWKAAQPTSDIQHGYLLAPEIRDTLQTVSVEMIHDEQKDWQFFRERRARHALAARGCRVSRGTARHRRRRRGAHGVKLDVWDVVALNAWLEFPYYDKLDAKKNNLPSPAAAAEHCSAFVATGSYTKDGRVVIGHNNWTSYQTGERWNIIFDIVPAQGNASSWTAWPD